jgi:hypothetical protein
MLGEYFEAIMKTYPTVEFYCWKAFGLLANYGHTSIHIIVDVDLKDHVIFPYCGLRSL